MKPFPHNVPHNAKSLLRGSPASLHPGLNSGLNSDLNPDSSVLTDLHSRSLSAFRLQAGTVLFVIVSLGIGLGLQGQSQSNYDSITELGANRANHQRSALLRSPRTPSLPEPSEQAKMGSLPSAQGQTDSLPHDLQRPFDPRSPLTNSLDPPTPNRSVARLDRRTAVSNVSNSDPLGVASSWAESSAPTPLPPHSFALTLADAVALALQNNLSLKNAYLQRILDRQDLELAESRFAPQVTPQLRITYNADRLGTALSELNTTRASIGTGVTLPTGANLTVEFGGDHRLIPGRQQEGGQNLSVSFRQPLLRGFGLGLNRIPIETARLQEQINVLTLQDQVMNVITNVIAAYYDLLKAQEQVDIQQRSLERSQQQRRITEAFIQAGRTARLVLVEVEADEARRQLSLAEAQNSLQQQQLALIQILNLSLDLTDRPVAIEKPEVTTLIPWLQNDLIALAFSRNPTYLQQDFILAKSQLALKVAQDQQGWNLDVETTYQQAVTSDTNDRHRVDVGLTLRRTFGDRNQSQAVRRQEVAIQQQTHDKEKSAKDLTVQVTNLTRDVVFNFEQVKLAKRSRELAEQQLNNERIKFKRSLQGAQLDDVLRAEDAVVEARNSELQTTIAYLNTVARLEAVLGLTLETWNVTLMDETPP